MKTTVIAAIITAALAMTTVYVHPGEGAVNKVDKILDLVEMNKGQIAAPVENEVPASVFRMLQERNKMILLVCLIVMTPLFLFLVLYHIKKAADHSSEEVVHGSALVLVIQGTTFIVVAAPTSEQLTAAIGVLGAIAGYLFGSAARKKEKV